MNKTTDECNLKPGERCGFCHYTRPKRKEKTRTLCGNCGQPFTKGQRRRLLRGKWVHVGVDTCF